MKHATGSDTMDLEISKMSDARDFTRIPCEVKLIFECCLNYITWKGF